MKMKIFAVLFLALMVQGGDLRLELSKLPSEPEVKWLTTNDVAVQMATSGRQVKLASENSEWSGLSDLPVVTANEWTTEEEIIRMAGRRQVNLAYAGDQPQPGFPNFLGFGTREELRNFIVAVRGMGIGIWLTIQYEKSTGGYFQIMVGRQTEGYVSFDAMLEDTVSGWNALIEQLRLKTNYKAGSEILVQIGITYFNDNNNIIPKPFGLGLVRGNKWTRNTISATEIVNSFASFEEFDKEVMVVSFPEIQRFELQLSLTNNIITTMTWTKEAGAQLASSWPRPESPERVKEQYVGISGWLCDTSRRMRMRVSTKAGEETYTEFGRRLTEPTVLRMEGKDTLVVNTPKGADIEVRSSPNLQDWTSRGFVNRVTGKLVLSVPDEGRMFYESITR